MARTILLWSTLATLALPQARPDRTVEWVYGPEAAELGRVAEHQWLADGTLALWDYSTEGFGAGVRRLDPATGKETPLASVMLHARSIMKLDREAVAQMAFPDAIDGQGRHALYVLAGDVFVVELASRRALRVTKTEAEEHAVRFSPDGTKVAFVRENDLYVHDLEEGRTRRLTHDGSETILNGTLTWVYWEEIFGRQDLGYWWSDDSRRLAFLRTDVAGVAQTAYLDYRGEYTRATHQRYPRAGDANPDVTVGLVDVTADEPAPRWVAFGEHHPEYVARVQWLPGGERVAVQTLNRAQTRLDLLFAEAATGRATPILHETDEAWVNVHDDLRFLAGGKHFLWVSERSGYAHLYRYALDGKLVNQVTKGEFALRDPGGVFWLRQAVKAVDEKAGLAWVSSLKKSSVESHLYRVKLDGSEMTRVTEEDGTHKVFFSPNADYYLDEYSRAKRPPSLTLHRRDGTVVKVITPARTAAAKTHDFSYAELLTVKARDGFPMPAYLYRPKDFDATKKHPVIVYGYGGPSAPSVSDSWPGPDLYFNQLLVDRGFVVACIDNRSATAISKKLENTIDRQMYGDGELRDLLDGVAWLKAQPWVDGERVGIWGWSGGATLTLLGMTRSKEFKAGIAVAAVTDWHFYDTKWAESVMKRPSDNPAGYARTDLNRRAKDLHGRLLLVHGSSDDNVHLQNAFTFADALIEAGTMFDMMIYPMRKHGIADRPARIHLFKTMLEFWSRHL